MIVTNPTEKTIAIQYKGTKYEVAAEQSITVPDEAAIYWKDRIHEFIILTDENEAPSKSKVEKTEKAEKVEEVKADIVGKTK